MSIGLEVVGLLALAAFPVQLEGEAPCPLIDPTRAALERYLGASSAGAMVLELRSTGASIDLALRSESEIVLARSFELDAIACEDVPDAVALVVERFFRDLGWTPGTPDLPRPPVPVATPPVPPPPAPLEPAEEEPGAPRPVPTEPPNSTSTSTTSTAQVSSPLELALHAGAELRGMLPLELGAAAKLELSIEWFRLTAEASFSRPEVWTVTRAESAIGEIGAWILNVDLGLGGCSSTKLRWCGRAFGGVESVFASPSGEIFQANALIQNSLELGLGTTLEWALGSRFELVGSLGLRFRPAPVSFSVEDADEASYARPKASVLLGLGFRSKIF